MFAPSITLPAVGRQFSLRAISFPPPSHSGKRRRRVAASSLLTGLRLPFCLETEPDDFQSPELSKIDYWTFRIRATPGWARTLCTSSISNITVSLAVRTVRQGLLNLF